MAYRLPTPGSDNGQWGQLLNDYLSVEHNADGTLKKAGEIAAKYEKPVGGIPSGDLSSGVQSSLVKADGSVQSVNASFPVSGNVTLDAAAVGAIPSSQKGAISGIAELDSAGRLPENRLPTTGISKVYNDNVAVRIFGGRMSTLNVAATTTFHVALEVPVEYDGVQIIFANTDPRFCWPVNRLSVCSIPSATDLNGSSLTWTPGMANGPGLGSLNQRNAPGSSRVGYTLSDVLPVQSVPRSDGGTKPIVAVRAAFTPSGTLPVVGNGTDDFTNWASRSDGHRYVMRSQAVSAATAGVNTSAFTSTTNQSQSPIVGVRLLCRGRVVNVMNVGDSIDEGRGTYLGAGYNQLVCDTLSTTSVAFVQSNLGWSGQSSGFFYSRVIDALRDPNIRPDILILPTMTPNDGTPLTATMFTNASIWRTQIIAECRRRKVVPVFRTMLPVAPSVHSWGSSDALRRADNAAALMMNDQGVIVVDTASLFETSIDGNGQMGINATLAPDLIHPGDAGYQAMSGVLAPAVARAGLLV
jgi:lysophospholipase L1-like esterase